MMGMSARLARNVGVVALVFGVVGVLVGVLAGMIPVQACGSVFATQAHGAICGPVIVGQASWVWVPLICGLVLVGVGLAIPKR